MKNFIPSTNHNNKRVACKYENFCEGTLGRSALASPLPFLDKIKGAPGSKLAT